MIEDAEKKMKNLADTGVIEKLKFENRARQE
jgi:hypothetical protein